MSRSGWFSPTTADRTHFLLAAIPDEGVRAELAQWVTDSRLDHDLARLDAHDFGPRRADLLRRVWPQPERALQKLIGANRATILHELERPATSTELATQLDLSFGTIGGHLTVLRDAVLITGTRVGRRVIYHRTQTGDLIADNENRW